jgi:hypothetical protein
MENLKEGRKKNRIESRMTKSLSHYEREHKNTGKLNLRS